VSRVAAQGAAFDFQELFAAAFAVIGLPAAAQAEQVLGQQQVQHRGDVDRERPGPGERDALGQLPDLQGQEHRGRDGSEVLPPAGQQPQPDGLDRLDRGVAGQQGRDQGESGGLGGQGVLELVDQGELVEVDAGGAQRR